MDEETPDDRATVSAANRSEVSRATKQKSGQLGLIIVLRNNTNWLIIDAWCVLIIVLILLLSYVLLCLDSCCCILWTIRFFLSCTIAVCTLMQHQRPQILARANLRIRAAF